MMNLDVALEVHNIEPEYSSIQGGNIVTISGFGFETDNLTPSKDLNSEFDKEHK